MKVKSYDEYLELRHLFACGIALGVAVFGIAVVILSWFYYTLTK
jgi:hypothetical protein